MAVSSSRYTTTEGLDTSVQNMEESRSAFPETHPQTLGMPVQRTGQPPAQNAGLLPTQMMGQPPAPQPPAAGPNVRSDGGPGPALMKNAVRHVRQVLATWRGMLEGMRASASVS